MANGISEILQFQQTQAQPQINKNTLDNVTQSKKPTLSSESCHGILSLRQKDILQLVEHIQFIDQNDPKLVHQLFSEIEKLGYLYLLSKQEMRTISLLNKW